MNEKTKGGLTDKEVEQLQFLELLLETEALIDYTPDARYWLAAQRQMWELQERSEGQQESSSE
jgi:hypothetical protein